MHQNPMLLLLVILLILSDSIEGAEFQKETETLDESDDATETNKESSRNTNQSNESGTNTSLRFSRPEVTKPSFGGSHTFFFLTLYSLCMLLLIFGNIGVIAIILKSPELRKNPSNLQFLSLLTARAAIGVFVVPTGIAAMFASENTLGGAFCRSCYYFATVSGTASIFSIITVAIVKYRSVALDSPVNISMKHSAVVIIAIWVISFLYAIRTAVFYDLVIIKVNDKSFYSCTVAPPYVSWNNVFMIVDVIFLYVLPLISISFCYSRVMTKLAASTAHMFDEHTKRATIGVIKMLAILIGLFTVCTLPPYVVKIYVFWMNGPFDGMDTVMLYVNLFSYSNGWFNVIVFAVYRDDLRRSFKQITCIKRCYRDNQVAVVAIVPRVARPTWTKIEDMRRQSECPAYMSQTRIR